MFRWSVLAIVEHFDGAFLMITSSSLKCLWGWCEFSPG
jgi:hypothetical protein